jgi:hypothetical protein
MWVPSVPELLWVIVLMALLIGCLYGVFSDWEDNLLQRAAMAVMAWGATAEIKATVTYTHCPTALMVISTGAVLFALGVWHKSRRTPQGQRPC